MTGLVPVHDWARACPRLGSCLSMTGLVPVHDWARACPRLSCRTTGLRDPPDDARTCLRRPALRREHVTDEKPVSPDSNSPFVTRLSSVPRDGVSVALAIATTAMDRRMGVRGNVETLPGAHRVVQSQVDRTVRIVSVQTSDDASFRRQSIPTVASRIVRLLSAEALARRRSKARPAGHHPR